MKRIPQNKWFSLPRLGRDVFSELMRARVKYDTKFGFKFTPETDVQKALTTLSKALEEQVELESCCFICGKPLGTDDKPGAILCADCVNLEDAYALYTMKFAKIIDEL